MAGLVFSNFGKAQVGSAPSGTTGLSFTVAAGTGLLFPSLGVSDYFYGIFKDASGNREVVKVTARSTDAMTIPVGGRGLDGTTARTWAAGDYFVLGVTNIALAESLGNANLGAIANLVSATDQLPYFTGSGTAAVTGFSAFIRTLMNDADAATARATLGVSASAVIIPVGSVTNWFQAAAPVGWTQVATHNDKAMRIVSGVGGGSGGSVAFTAAFASKAVAGSNSATTLTSAQIPAHSHLNRTSHTSTAVSAGAGDTRMALMDPAGGLTSANGADNTGGGGSHNHTFTGTAINLAVQYIDNILASKN